jgi:hypothetical protein
MDHRDFLDDARKRAHNEAVQISIRDFIAQWGAKRRGYWIVDQIKRDLEKYDLTTDPPFTDGWIDTRIALVPKAPVATKEQADDQQPLPSPDTDAKPTDVTLLVGSLPSSNLGVKSVALDDTLEMAQFVMLRYDYSQLAVMSGVRNLRGAVSWESIAQAKIRNPAANLKDALVAVDVVRSGDDLLAKIPRIIDSGFVFVQAPDNTISGIVTTADLSAQFVSLATPFFLLAEIERRLRRVIGRKFTLEELQEIVDPLDGDREIHAADDLTYGEYCRLLELPERWEKLGWTLDRKEFVKALHEVREVRNDVMHFSPDPLEEEQVQRLRTFLKWLRRMDGS